MKIIILILLLISSSLKAEDYIFEGSANDLPKSNASKIAKKGMEYKVEYLEAQGWGKKKAAPKKAAPKKAAPKAENKAVKPEDVEDK